MQGVIVAAPRKHRDAIVQAAAGLFRRQGYAATGLAEIVTQSGAPTGSVYHYFPGGKAQIGAAAVTLAGKVVTDTLTELLTEAGGPSALIRLYAARLAGWMRDGSWSQGCPIATVLLETAPGDAGMTKAGEDAFAAWAGVLETALAAAGSPPSRAGRLARVAIATLEGALIQARVARSGVPLTEAAEEIAGLFDSACLTGKV